MFPARAIEIDKIDYMMSLSIVIQETVSHNGERSTISPKRRSPPGHLDRSENRRRGLWNQCTDLHMRARGWAAASASSPIGVCVTTSIGRRIAQELSVREADALRCAGLAEKRK
jgi:hypothetical protein